MAVYEIPLNGNGPQTFGIQLPDGFYNMRVVYADAPNGEGGWLLDIADSNGNPLVLGIPLVTGADLLAQYEYLGIGVVMFCVSDGDNAAPPTFANLGKTSHFYVEY